MHETSQWVSAHQRIHHLRAENNRSRVHGSSHRPTLTHVAGDLRENTRIKGETRVQARLHKHGGWESLTVRLAQSTYRLMKLI